MIVTQEPKVVTTHKINTPSKNKIDMRDYISQRSHYLLNKRCFDIFISLLVTVFVLSWLLPLLALIIKLDSRGPVFFVQKRVGFLGRTFRCIKLRTMYTNLDANALQARENDPRITKLGKFLRKSNLDELPQFLNVLTGDMSIVGPRPHMHNDCIAFSRVIESYKFRSILKPGITGLAQIKGYRGPTENFEKVFKRFQWDAFYIRNANFWLDLRIIRKTAVQTVGYIVRPLRKRIDSNVLTHMEIAR